MIRIVNCTENVKALQGKVHQIILFPFDTQLSREREHCEFSGFLYMSFVTRFSYEKLLYIGEGNTTVLNVQIPTAKDTSSGQNLFEFEFESLHLLMSNPSTYQFATKYTKSMKLKILLDICMNQ